METIPAPGEPAEVIARRVGEKLQVTVGTVVSAIDYPISEYRNVRSYQCDN